jgi:hypothetical protein
MKAILIENSPMKLASDIVALGRQEGALSTEEVVRLLKLVKTFADSIWRESGYSTNTIKSIHTKFNDAGRRSAPWKAYSSKTPGRPQDGNDGNRINRWLLPPSHKFYATEKDATLVQIRYYLQTFSMMNAPDLPKELISESLEWITDHSIRPGSYLDPIQLLPIDINSFFSAPRDVTSGHLLPLDRGGKHVYKNAFLMLRVSNQLQGNQTVDELLDLMRGIVGRHETLNFTHEP